MIPCSYEGCEYVANDLLELEDHEETMHEEDGYEGD